jgi:hypothetical protein
MITGEWKPRALYIFAKPASHTTFRFSKEDLTRLAEIRLIPGRHFAEM